MKSPPRETEHNSGHNSGHNLEYTPEEMLEMLRFQAEIGVDECLLDEPLLLETVLTADLPITNVDNASLHASSLPSSPPIQASAPTQETTPTWASAPTWTSAESLDALRDMAASFNGCDLKKTASSMVFADGNPQAEIMLIGEAPGADEDRQGKPFVGASGQLLDKMLASIHLDRSTVYITNILPWRPPGNRTPTPEELAMFLPMIKQHIKLVAPKMVVTLGGASTKVMRGVSDGILKLRGQWGHYDNDGTEIPMLAMLHPAYLLRTPAQKGLTWKDLRQLHHKAHALKLKYLDQSR